MDDKKYLAQFPVNGDMTNYKTDCAWDSSLDALAYVSLMIRQGIALAGRVLYRNDAGEVVALTVTQQIV